MDKKRELGPYEEQRVIRGEIRPWGGYEVLAGGELGKAKRIYVDKNQQLSLQRHYQREEHWVILKGRGTITIGNREFNAEPGSYFSIPQGTTHRATAGKSGLEFLELAVPFGQDGMVDESDIERLEDDYGRAK